MATTETLFVYGTLAPGKPNHHVLADIPGTWQVATLHGELVAKGWGAKLGSPAIIPAPSVILTSPNMLPSKAAASIQRTDAPWVSGVAFSSSELHQHWPMLDAFEGAAYARLLVAITLIEPQTVISAYVYAWRTN